MKNTTKKARELKSDLKKLGFEIIGYKEQDFIERTIRRNTARYIAGRNLMDTNGIFQMGINEVKTTPVDIEIWNNSDINFEWLENLLFNDPNFKAPFFVIGPDNKWIATLNQEGK